MVGVGGPSLIQRFIRRVHRRRLRIRRGAFLLFLRRCRKLGEHRSLARGLLAHGRVLLRGCEGSFELGGGGGGLLEGIGPTRLLRLRVNAPRGVSLSLLHTRRVLRLEVLEHAPALLLDLAKLLGDGARGRRLRVGFFRRRFSRLDLLKPRVLGGVGACVRERGCRGRGPLRGVRGVQRAFTRGLELGRDGCGDGRRERVGEFSGAEPRRRRSRLGGFESLVNGGGGRGVGPRVGREDRDGAGLRLRHLRGRRGVDDVDARRGIFRGESRDGLRRRLRRIRQRASSRLGFRRPFRRAFRRRPLLPRRRDGRLGLGLGLGDARGGQLALLAQLDPNRFFALVGVDDGGEAFISRLGGGERGGGILRLFRRGYLRLLGKHA